MADAVVTFLLESVTQLVRHQVNLISSAENELEELKKDLESLSAFLEKADITNKDQVFTVLERQIREVVHDAEDTIDKCLITSKSKRGFSLLRGHGIKRTVSLAKEVKSVRHDMIKPMLDEARKYFERKGEGSSKGVKESWTAVEKVQLIREDNVVGFKDEEEIILKYLNEGKEKLDVITIIGMPGVGKTTLAWKIFQNEKIQYEFPVRIWVYVSQDCNARSVFLNILKGFTQQDMSSLSDADLIEAVHAYLSHTKFLLVMDDVWKTEDWDTIKHGLPKNTGMSKVLITSRDWIVGKHANGSRDPHKLRLLDSDESWELLQLEAFGKLNDCPQELQEIGKAIAKQCDGLPLSLVVVGGILAKQYSATQPPAAICSAWEEVSQNVHEHVRNDEQNRPTDILELTYKNLPGNLRGCFLYLGVFPEDYEIPVWTLTRLWIAEGFVQPKEGQQSLEEIAEENLKYLINSNLVMVGRTSPTGEVKTCRVHDVIREFCKYKASIRDQNLFLQIHKSHGVFQPSASDIEKCRRLCIHSHVNDFLKEIPMEKLKAPLVRSFLCFCKDRTDFDPKCLSSIPDSFQLLRVLDSKSMKFNQFPPKVAKLIHLRYITLSVDNLNILPEDLSSLWNLQTLVVDTKSRVFQIKANIWKMIQLRHLKTKAEIILVIQEDGTGGENLQTLSRLSPQSCTQNVFRKAPNLKRLGIRGNLAILLDNGTSFQNFDSLETLKLKHDLSYGATSEKPLHGLPLPNCFPQHIKRLTLSTTYLEWKQMSTLAILGSLEILKLKDNAFVGLKWNAIGAGFPCLRFLLIENTNLVIWEASTSNDLFPRLSCLVLRNCEQLSSIPVGFAKSLEILKINNVPPSAVDSAKKIEEVKEQMQAREAGFELEIGPGCKI